MGPFNPESLATYPSRTTTGRTNAYPQPLSMKSLATGLPSFDVRGCTSGVTATLSPEAYKDPVFAERTKRSKSTPEENEKFSKNFFEALRKYAFAEQTDSAAIGAPGCFQQAPFNPIGRSGAATTYQHTFEQSK